MQPRGKTKRVKWPDVETRAKRIFGDRVLPDLVLLEREDAAFWIRTGIGLNWTGTAA